MPPSKMFLLLLLQLSIWTSFGNASTFVTSLPTALDESQEFPTAQGTEIPVDVRQVDGSSGEESESVVPPSPPPSVLPPAPPTPPTPPSTTMKSRNKTYGSHYETTSIYQNTNFTRVFGKKIIISRRKGRIGFGGNNHKIRGQGGGRPFHVYAVPGPRPVPVRPATIPPRPVPPPLPAIIITAPPPITTTRGPPEPLIPGQPAPLLPGAPSPLLPAGGPAPLSSPAQSAPANGALAQNIKCALEGQRQRLTATINRPTGFSSHPVFNDALGVNVLSDTNCRMTPLSSIGNQYLIEVSDFKACGVKSQRQGAENKEWMALTVRFPFISGLRLAEDEYIMVLCRPQERTRTQSHALDLRGNVARSSKSVFSSGPQAFQCDIALFRIGSAESAEKVTTGTAIEIGEKLQLRGEVRTGDGWKFARLTDVIVKRVGSTSKTATFGSTFSQNVAHGISSDALQQTLQAIQSGGYNGRRKRSGAATSYSASAQADIAFLVLSDGCRNPTFKPIAPYHPWRDQTNPLAVNFLFRAFMFENMKDGDSIRITARVMACVKEQDCNYNICSDDSGKGFGRKKRSTQGKVEYFDIDQEVFPNGTVRSLNNVTNFDDNLDLVIVSPGHLQRQLIKQEAEVVRIQSSAQSSYGIYFMTTVALSVALACAILMIIFLLVKKSNGGSVKNKKGLFSVPHLHSSTAEVQQQMAVVAAAATAAATAASTNSTQRYFNTSFDSDADNFDSKTLRKCHSKSSVRSCSSRRRRESSRCCYSSGDETFSESENDLKCSVV